MNTTKNKLPPTAVALSALIGNRLAMALMAHMNSNGRSHLYVPMRPKAQSALAHLIGQGAAKKLCAVYGGQTIRMPQCSALRRSLRDDDIRKMKAEGSTQKEIAKGFGMTVRQIRNILNGSLCNGEAKKMTKSVQYDVANHHVSFCVTHPMPWGGQTLEFPFSEFATYALDPVGFLAAHYGISKKQYLGWIDSGFSVQCCAKTVKGKQCKAHVTGMTLIDDPRIWAKYSAEGGYCWTHSRE